MKVEENKVTEEQLTERNKDSEVFLDINAKQDLPDGFYLGESVKSIESVPFNLKGPESMYDGFLVPKESPDNSICSK